MSTNDCEIYVIKKVVAGEHGISQRVVGKFSVEADGKCRHLCDYDGTLMSSIRNEIACASSEYRMALADLSSSVCYSVTKRSLSPAAPQVSSGAESQPASVFAYLRQGMQSPHVIELHAGRAALDGAPLEHDEVQQILANVRNGVAELRYHGATAHNADMGDRIQKAESGMWAAIGLSLGESLSDLRKMVDEGLFPKAQYDIIRRELYCDEMIPEIGNKRAYRDFASLPQQGSYVMVDLNALKQINDKLGHEAGDHAIVGVGQAMRRAIDGTIGDTKAKAWRIGGDEFCFYVHSSTDAPIVIRALRQELEQIPPIGGIFPISISTGVGASPGEADSALYRAKAASKLDLGLDNRPAQNMYVSHHQPAAEAQKEKRSPPPAKEHHAKGTSAAENQVAKPEEDAREEGGKQKLNMQMAQEIRAAHQGGMTMKDLAYKYDVTDRLISDVVHNRIWVGNAKSETDWFQALQKDGESPETPSVAQPPQPKPPKPAAPALVAVHNLSEKSLSHAHKMGGLPVPSIAVAHKKFHFGEFGDVTLIAHHDMVDPKTTPVFDADVFSPRYPQVVHHVDEEKLGQFKEAMKAHEKEIGQTGLTERTFNAKNIHKIGDSKGAANHLLSSAFLKEKGGWPTPPVRNGVVVSADHEDAVGAAIKGRGLEKEFADWKKQRLGSLVTGQSMVSHVRGADGKMSKVLVPHTLENVVKEMSRGIRGHEDPDGIVGLHGAPGARAHLARQFSNKDEMKDARKSLRPIEEVREHEENMTERLESLAEEGKQHWSSPDRDGTQTALLQVLQNLGTSKVGLGEELRRAGFKPTTTRDFLRKVNKYGEDLKNGPTSYFEAKPQRAVGLHEFKAAVVPHDAHPDTLDILRQHGVVHVEKYRRDDPEDRWAAVRRIAEPQKLALSEGDW